MSNQPRKGLLLLSGGFDSPVAGKLMQRQGLAVDAIHFSLEPVTDGVAEQKCLDLARVLALQKVYVAKVGEELARIAARCTRRYYFVLSKRFMLRVAEMIARRDGYDFLVTGENLGQVSSQTLQNLTVIDNAAGMTVLRPLLGFDKIDIINVAKELGTYDISKGPEICDALGPDSPATAASVPDILEEEAKIDLGELAKTAVAKMSLHAVAETTEAAR